VGLNFTHVDVYPFNQFTLEWECMLNWPWYLWAVFAIMISFFGLNLLYLGYLYHISHCLWEYGVLTAVIVVYCVGRTYLQ
jgi:hypothetical protein